MPKYIDADALKIQFPRDPSEHLALYSDENIKTIIDNMPAADVRENTHGQWIEDDYAFNHCSECGYELEYAEYVTPYCPQCGASMEPDPEEATEEKQSPLGKRISEMLEKKGITQREYAEMIGVTEVAMSRFIKGERIPPVVHQKINRDIYRTAHSCDCKMTRHKAICDGIHDLYERKNHDYGDSFGQSFRDHGILAGVIRIEDKFNRLKTLAGGSEQKVQDESIRDTLRDMANYAIMTLLEMEVCDGKGG